MNLMCIDVGLAVSQRHTYLFSAGDDKQVKCWDLEQNKVCIIFLVRLILWHIDTFVTPDLYSVKGYSVLSWASQWGLLPSTPSNN